jgi:hypothetical protein
MFIYLLLDFLDREDDVVDSLEMHVALLLGFTTKGIRNLRRDADWLGAPLRRRAGTGATAPTAADRDEPLS